MNAIVHIGSHGTIQLPREILSQLKPSTPYSIRIENARVILEPTTQEGSPFWKTATPQQRAERFRNWADSHKPGIGVLNSAFSRDSIYN